MRRKGSGKRGREITLLPKDVDGSDVEGCDEEFDDEGFKVEGMDDGIERDDGEPVDGND